MLRLSTLLLFAVAFPEEGGAKHWIHVDSDAPKSEKTALLILNGFGGTRGGCKAQMAYWEDSGMDVYIRGCAAEKIPCGKHRSLGGLCRGVRFGGIR